MTKNKYHKIEVGLSGTGHETSSWRQELFYGYETEAIIRRIWLGILANGDTSSYVNVRGSDGFIQWSCTANQNPSIDDFQLPEPFMATTLIWTGENCIEVSDLLNSQDFNHKDGVLMISTDGGTLIVNIGDEICIEEDQIFVNKQPRDS